MPFAYLIENKENLPDIDANMNYDTSKEPAMLLISTNVRLTYSANVFFCWLSAILT